MGLLQRIEERNVIVVADGKEYNLAYDQIENAHIVPD
ncbi:hypothetical protein THIOM_005059 [Candidatus Thiomargarita nelsonii]|uniref:Uncharacterized protein n=1 Tax=Candidatus Thiomargarita nelsonii TaxID=1003181 RepID=A0A176RU92_9GAMM|nr:hypothetical protein THIOM_005059 [Candidatus Thiomargarita nelsonii]